MKKGFTLIELLATIIILALIALVTYPIIDNIVSDSREDLYAKQIDELERHANTWVTKNFNSLRMEDGYVRKITYVDLKNESLIADANVKDPRTGEPLPGCILAIWNGEVTNFDVQYDEDCTYDGTTILPSKVTFTLNGTSHEVDENTSWTTFLQTNTDYEVSGENVVLKGTTRKVLLNGTAIDKDSTITAGTYTLEEETTNLITLAVDANSNGEAELGDEVCIGNECFYVLTNDGTNIRMLAKYRIDASDNTTRKERLQNTGTLTTKFSSSTIQGTKPSSYEGSIVEDLVGDYKATLEGLGATISEATLLSYDEVTSAPFNCQIVTNDLCSLTWLYKDGNTTAADHWTRSAVIIAPGSVYIVNGSGHYGDYAINIPTGVRPVVTISTSSI